MNPDSLLRRNSDGKIFKILPRDPAVKDDPVLSQILSIKSAGKATPEVDAVKLLDSGGRIYVSTVSGHSYTLMKDPEER